MTQSKNIRRISFDTIDSTYLWAKKNAASFNPEELTCITADQQTAGIGRFKRAWHSPKGENIYATVYFTLPKEATYLAQIAQLLSLSCALVLKNKGFQPEIKWPNDLLLAGKKVSGIICEILTFKDYYGVVLGFGVNVNMKADELDQIDQPATSLAQISGKHWECDEILLPILYQFLDDLVVLQEKGFSFFTDRYNNLLAMKGEMITCNLNPSSDADKVRGTCKSIDRDGRLELILPNGEVKKLISHDCHY